MVRFSGSNFMIVPTASKARAEPAAASNTSNDRQLHRKCMEGSFGVDIAGILPLDSVGR
jgi:hypothetical protein